MIWNHNQEILAYQDCADCKVKTVYIFAWALDNVIRDHKDSLSHSKILCKKVKYGKKCIQELRGCSIMKKQDRHVANNKIKASRPQILG